MNLNEIKDLMAQFNQSSLRELSYKNGAEELMFSKMKQEMFQNLRSQFKQFIPISRLKRLPKNNQ